MINNNHDKETKEASDNIRPHSLLNRGYNYA